MGPKALPACPPPSLPAFGRVAPSTRLMVFAEQQED
jgi:hypothetical protein